MNKKNYINVNETRKLTIVKKRHDEKMKKDMIQDSLKIVELKKKN